MDTENMQTDNSVAPRADATVTKPSSTISSITMQTYYDQFFPYKLFCRWLGYGTLGNSVSEDSKNLLSLREWSFTLDVNGAEVYQRYQSFDTPEALKEHVVKVTPSKIDIGAICNVAPKDHRKVRNFRFDTREFVIDIDMTDYDDVRTCCKDAQVCEKCWKFLAVGMQIIHTALTDDFGFQHIFWVFSGRRGVHCWVCDESARNFTNEQRAAVAEYLSVSRASLTNPLHPALQRALDIIKDAFEDVVIEDQQLFSTEQRYQDFVARAFEGDLLAKLNGLWDNHRRDPHELWAKVQSTVEREAKGPREIRKSLNWLYFLHLYPRLDVNVSVHVNHLLKSPFCVHPKTGLVCIPISPDQFETFKPSDAPLVSQMVDNVDNGANKSVANFKSALTHLEAFVKNLESSIRKSRIAKSQESGEW